MNTEDRRAVEDHLHEAQRHIFRAFEAIARISKAEEVAAPPPTPVPVPSEDQAPSPTEGTILPASVAGSQVMLQVRPGADAKEVLEAGDVVVQAGSSPPVAGLVLDAVLSGQEAGVVRYQVAYDAPSEKDGIARIWQDRREVTFTGQRILRAGTHELPVDVSESSEVPTDDPTVLVDLRDQVPLSRLDRGMISAEEIATINDPTVLVDRAVISSTDHEGRPAFLTEDQLAEALTEDPLVTALADEPPSITPLPEAEIPDPDRPLSPEEGAAYVAAHTVGPDGRALVRDGQPVAIVTPSFTEQFAFLKAQLIAGGISDPTPAQVVSAMFAAATDVPPSDVLPAEPTTLAGEEGFTVEGAAAAMSSPLMSRDGPVVQADSETLEEVVEAIEDEVHVGGGPKDVPYQPTDEDTKDGEYSWPEPNRVSGEVSAVAVEGEGHTVIGATGTYDVARKARRRSTASAYEELDPEKPVLRASTRPDADRRPYVLRGLDTERLLHGARKEVEVSLVTAPPRPEDVWGRTEAGNFTQVSVPEVDHPQYLRDFDALGLETP